MDALRFLNNVGWHWQLGKESLTICPPNQEAADFLLDTFSASLAATAHRLGATIVLSWGDIIHYRISPKETLIMTSRLSIPSVFIGDIEITSPLLPIITEILESPDKHMGLVRINDNAQLMISAASARQIQTPGSDAVKRNTNLFWLAESLETLAQCYRDSPESGFTITYTATLDKPKTDPTALWGRFTTQFRLIEDAFGIVYRKGELLDFAQISRPAVVL